MAAMTLLVAQRAPIPVQAQALVENGVPAVQVQVEVLALPSECL